MTKIVKQFEGTPIRMLLSNNVVYFAAHNVSEALKFESPRSEVINLNIESQYETMLIDWDTNSKEFMVDVNFIVDLLLRAQTSVARRLVRWLLEMVVEVRNNQQEPLSPVILEVTDKSYAITQIAKKYGMTGMMLNEFLHLNNIQYKVNDQWVLKEEYQDKGFIVVKTFPKRNSEGSTWHTYWTRKGVAFIEAILRKQGIREVPFLTSQQINLFEGENK